ncbi:MAG: hypothetical protein WAQ27_05950 [Candidatus Microsaccharimonas sp.]
MTIIETAPQKSKEYTKQKDHGTKANKRVGEDSYWDKKADRAGIVNQDKELLTSALNEYYRGMSAEELEAEADYILGIADEGDSEYTITSSNQDRFITEAELGLDSKADIRRKMAERATLDPRADDDDGDSDYASPIRITNRL